ncbi:hypothetical protein GPJ56_004090 [Histomonas meleagridis]|uniref:uncharacterized protein n=1 Tax=Histomonas meleagridis TaxID=135588 RepID=UPI00355A93C4|nr:hypothetical protein GPJ56_004090 [Histomonas meleagridis]KAH0799487.1 hypothetical protein GO595_007742 [Histomonas meleagridis]
MSGFENFATCISRYKIKELSEIIPEEKVVEGPQTMISSYYKRITCLAGNLKNSAAEQDKLLPPELACFGIVSEAFGYLGQFHEYIPKLISQSESTKMASYVPALLESLETVSATFKKALDLIPKCEQYSMEKSPKVDLTQHPYAHTAAAIINITENSVVDFNFLLQNDSIQSSPQHQQLLQMWAGFLFQFTDAVFSQALQDSSTINAVLSTLSAITPNLISTVASIQSFAESSDELASIAVNAIILTNLLNVIESAESMASVKSIITKALSAYSNTEDMNTYSEDLNKMLDSFTKSANSFDPLIVKTAQATISDKIKNGKENPKLAAISAFQIVRSFLQTTSDSETSEFLLIQTAIFENQIVRSLLQRSHQISKGIKQLYESNLIEFNEQALGQINYFTTILLSIPDISTDDPNYQILVKCIAGCITSIPIALGSLKEECANEELQKTIDEYIKLSEEISDEFLKLSHELIMCIMTVVIMRASVASTTLSFLKMSNIKLPDEINEISNTLRLLLKEIPQLLLCDLQKAMSIKDCLVQLSLSIGSFRESLKSISSDSPLIKIAESSISIFTKPIPSLTSSLNLYLDFQRSDTFVSALVGLISASYKNIQNSPHEIEQKPESTIDKLATSFSQLATAFGMAEKAGQEGESVSSISQAAKQTMDSIWKLCVDLANGNPVDIAQLKQYLQVLNDVLSNVVNSHKLRMPSIECDMPEEIKQLKKYEAIANSLAPPLKDVATDLLKKHKKMDDPFSKDILKNWFETVNEEFDANSAPDEFAKSISDMLRNDSPTQDQINAFMKDFSKMSVAIFNEHYGEPYDSMIRKCHDDIIDLIQKFYKSGFKDKSALLEMYAKLQQIIAIKKLLLLSENERNELYKQDLERLLKYLHTVRSKTTDSTYDEIGETLRLLKEVEMLLFMNGTKAEELEKMLSDLYKTLTNKEFNFDIITEAIRSFTEKHLLENPNTFNSIKTVKDNNVLLDMIYNKAENFRKEGTSILKSIKSKDKTTQEILIKTLRNMGKYSFEGSAIAFHSLDIAGLQETINSKSSIRAFVKILSTFSKFSPIVRKLLSDKEENIGMDLRKMIRKMAKQFDALINLVESPQKPNDELSEFDKLRLKMLSDLVNISYSIDGLNCLATNAIVPEMYEEEKNIILEELKKHRSEFEASSKEVIDRAVCETKDEFQELINQFYTELDVLNEKANNVNFLDEFPAQPVLDESEKVCSLISKITKVAQSLIDHIIIQPDPTSAALLPDDFIIPEPPETAPSLQEAFDLLKQAYAKMNGDIKTFENGIADPYALSETLLSCINTLKLNSDDFVGTALTVSVATKDPLKQVEQHTAIHAFSNAFNAVRDALRSRLMRASEFGEEMDDALANMRACLERVMEIAEESLRSEQEALLQQQNQAEEDDSNDDEVTRALKSTANSIQEMTDRLKQFSEQIDSSVDMSNIDIDNIDADSLPAYVISEANPILEATRKIVIRAQEITAERVANFGRIQNEGLLINSARDLSEAAALLIISAEILIAGEDKEANWKVISAARIVKASVSGLVAQVLVDGGDPENIMQQQIKVVQIHTDNIVKRALMIIKDKMDAEEAQIKQSPSLMIRKLNLQNRINNVRKELESEEKVLYQFRKRF